jgi:hypothetical protein
VPPAGLAVAVGPVLEWLDLAGIFVFAASGALLAAAKRQTLVTFIFFAVITGVGGGTVRDLLIGAPVFWIAENTVLLICFAAALIVWMLPRRWLEGRLLDWLDAAGLAAYASFGAAKGFAFGVAPLPAIGMGVLTACLGGIIRDVLRRRAVHPDAAGAVRDRRRPFGRADGRAAPGRITRCGCRPDRLSRRLRSAGRGDRPRLVASRLLNDPVSTPAVVRALGSAPAANSTLITCSCAARFALVMAACSGVSPVSGSAALASAPISIRNSHSCQWP